MTALLILHVPDDHDAVTALADRLAEAGIGHELVDVQRRHSRAQRKQLRQRLLAARAVVVVISAASADSDALLREVEFARRVKGGDEPIIPLVIGPPTAGSPFDGLPVDAVVVNELRHLDAVNARDGSDPIPGLFDPQPLPMTCPSVSAGSGWVPVSITLPAERAVAIQAIISFVITKTPSRPQCPGPGDCRVFRSRRVNCTQPFALVWAK